MRTFSSGKIINGLAILFAVLAISSALFATGNVSVQAALGSPPFTCPRCDVRACPSGNGVCLPGGPHNCPQLLCSTTTDPGTDTGCPSGQFVCNNKCVPNGTICSVDTGPTPDFKISDNYSAPGSPLSIEQNTAGTITITLDKRTDISPVPPFPTSGVTLTSVTATAPSGGTMDQSILPTVCTSVCTATLTLSGNTVGSYHLTITGTANTVHSAEAYITVTTPPPPPPGECAPDTGPDAQPLCGYAWGGTDEGSDTGIGWLSFNSDNNSYDSAHPYHVAVSGNGALTGCAWSPNIGWVKFGGATPFANTPNFSTDFPSYSHNTQPQATLDSYSFNSNFQTLGDITGMAANLKGWARACAGTVNGDCSTMESRTDGWDGWISLKNSNKVTDSSVVHFDGGVFSGNAWGSDVVGWLNFSPTSNPSDGVHMCAVTIPDFSLVGSQTTIPKDGTGVNPSVTVGSVGGHSFPSNVHLAVVTVPSGMQASFNQGADCAVTNCSKNLHVVVTDPNITSGSHTIRVSGTADAGSQGTIVHYADVIVSVSDVATNDFSVVCTPPPAAEQPVYVNTPVLWRVGVTNKSDGTTATGPFKYQAVYDGGSPVSGTSADGSNPFSVSKTYSTIGKKTFKAQIVDDSGAVIGSFCPETSVLVKVKPKINEK